ncbi:hypothetical protein [Frateuria defendens]|uniref:hypothetical protein n=1 Tax=Frateuria defendens TaxID=2219559 RepID=UPI00066FD452|nr:hypothetical protein [Frateuria defendens]
MNTFVRSLPALALLAAAGLAAPPAARAGDGLLIQRVQQERGLNLPARGLSMAQVEQRYGTPQRKLSPRGGDSRRHPPINRWEYPTFIVYFEHSHVIHAVLNTPAGNNTHPATVN